MNRSFWAGKRVLVTGHTGFKGSWLVCWLQMMGAEVTGLALAPLAGPSLFRDARVAEGMRSIEGDVRDAELVARVVAECDPEIILHLAAQALVRPSYDDPLGTYATNVMGTLHVLEAARRAPSLRVALMVTSDKAYENQEWIWAYRENDALGGRDPYSNSKACAELAVDCYRRSFFPPDRHDQHHVAVATARAGNVIGGGDWATDRLVPDILRALGERRPVHVRSPDATRPWQFVLGAVHGYLLLAERLWVDGPRHSEGWNFGPDVVDVQTVGWIVDYMSRRWGDGASWTRDEGQRPHEAQLLMLDCTKSKRLLGWHPRLPLAQTLDWIIEWYRAHLEGRGDRALLEQQIQRYEALT
jgi:CDP-glucose 4,6-dehydratase